MELGKIIFLKCHHKKIVSKILLIQNKMKFCKYFVQIIFMFTSMRGFSNKRRTISLFPLSIAVDNAV